VDVGGRFSVVGEVDHPPVVGFVFPGEARDVDGFREEVSRVDGELVSVSRASDQAYGTGHGREIATVGVGCQENMGSGG